MTSQAKNTEDTASGQSSAGMQRRRLEAEMLMYQSDRAKLLRAKEGAEIDLRVLQKEIDAKEALLVHKKGEVDRAVREIQQVDNELLRLRKRFNSI